MAWNFSASISCLSMYQNAFKIISLESLSSCQAVSVHLWRGDGDGVGMAFVCIIAQVPSPEMQNHKYQHSVQKALGLLTVTVYDECLLCFSRWWRAWDAGERPAVGPDCVTH